jgi:hypothetical protein
MLDGLNSVDPKINRPLTAPQLMLVGNLRAT